MISSRSIYLTLVVYFVVLLGIAPVNILSFDTYYYWDWSRHLALSYYDGSPLIAYFIRFSTILFGNSLFALSFVGIASTAITSGIIYKTARFFLSKAASCIAMFSWLFAPLVTLDMLKQTTYDAPLTLFWALTLYYTVKFIHTKQIKELYFIGASAGLMMLSKYTGIILILSLLIFFIFSAHRSIFKTKHFYFALLLALIIFSPVLIWNYQNHWQSFIYQLSTHQVKDSINPLYHMIRTFFILFLPSLNIMIMPPFLVRYIKPLSQNNAETCRKNSIKDDKNAAFVKLFRIVCLTFLCFYLIAASKTALRELWLAPYLISSAFLFGYYFEITPYRKLVISLIVIYGITSLCILIDNTSKYNFTNSKKLVSYSLIQQLNSSLPQLPNTVFTSGWFEARMLFFLKNKPTIYTLGCGNDQNQYALWGTDINKQIANKTLKEVFYIDRYDRQSCLEKYFDQCQKIPTTPYPFRHKEYALNVYKCMNF